jgi:hypothetical protein
VRWSDLCDQPARLAIELEKIGTTGPALVLDLRDAARDHGALQEELTRVGPGGWLRLALEWFGDLGHSQPTNRTLWSGRFRTPGWTVRRFPPLNDEGQIEAPPPRTRHGATRAPGPIPLALVERAVQLHERDGFGRRRIAKMVPGLSPYKAEQILGWYGHGKRRGLWLDGRGRLKWSRAISATSDGLILPRL